MTLRTLTVALNLLRLKTTALIIWNSCRLIASNLVVGVMVSTYIHVRK